MKEEIPQRDEFDSNEAYIYALIPFIGKDSNTIEITKKDAAEIAAMKRICKDCSLCHCAQKCPELGFVFQIQMCPLKYSFGEKLCSLVKTKMDQDTLPGHKYCSSNRMYIMLREKYGAPKLM